MEVDLRHRNTVDGALRLRDGAVDRQHVRLRLRVQMHVPDDVLDAVQAAVMVGMVVIVIVVVQMLVLLHAAAHHAEVRAGDAALLRAFGGHGHAGDAQRVEALDEPFRLRQQLQQRCGEHVPRRAHAEVKIQCFHAFLPPPMWLIRLARYPAPKPLSMLTTDTPDAQELSIDSSAEMPPKAVP